MTVFITAISPGTAQQHEHIKTIRWLNSADSTSKTMSVARAVTWIQEGNQLVVAGDDGPVAVQVVKADPPYLRTAANGKWSDNLVALPKF